MKCTIPEISWHNRDPVLSLDIQPQNKESSDPIRLATGGTDTHVLVWHLKIEDTGIARVEFAADLQRHQKAVNVVRWSPSGEFLASGDDEAVVLIWKQRTDQDAPELPGGDDETNAKEQWIAKKILRGHVEDVYDLSWSPDSNHLVSGSVDNTAILWDIPKGRNIGLLGDHKGFVQGVSWDPQNQYIATMSSDRTCRLFNIQTKRVVSRIYKSFLPIPGGGDVPDEKTVRLYHDDTLKSFFRRLTFTPDGELLITPTGLVELEGEGNKHINATYIYSRHLLNRPVVFLPTGDKYTIAVRCCPVLFELRPVSNGQENQCQTEGDEELKPWEKYSSLFALPYRIVFAVATQNSVLLYDTQQPLPFARISKIHYTRLSDLSWSSDGRILVVSSTDGYCSIITFPVGELGIELKSNSAKSDEDKSSDQSTGTKKEPKISADQTRKEITPTKQQTKKSKATGPQVPEVEVVEKCETKLSVCDRAAEDNSVHPKSDTERTKEESSSKKTSDDPVTQFTSPSTPVNQLKTHGINNEQKRSQSNETDMDVDEDFKLVLEDSQLTADESSKFAECSVKRAECSPSNILTNDKQIMLESPVQNRCNTTPLKDSKRTPGRRVPFITLSSPKSKKKLL